jgi:hypothetical protein
MFAQRQRPNANIDSVRQYLEEVYRLAPLVGLDPAIVVAQSAVETGNWGQIPGAGATAWLERRNPGSIGITSTGKPGEKDIDAGHSWKDGTDAARGQIVHLIGYADVRNASADINDAMAQTLDEYDHLDPRWRALRDSGYMGTVRLLSDLGNGKWAADKDYAAKIAARGNQIFGFKETAPVATYPSYPVLWNESPRREIQVESPVPIVQKIIPASHTAQRPGTKRRNPWKWVQHETGNPAAGANAEMHYRYIMGLTTQNVSFHFVVDDGQIIQLIPCDEVTWQAADGAGPGNYNGISCELCINSDGNKALSRRNAEWLAGGVLKADEGTVADVTRHYDYNQADPDRHYCPQLMMQEGYWPTFVTNVGKVIAGKPAEPAPTYATPVVLDLGTWDGKDRVLDDGTVMRACNRIVRARRKTKRYQLAADDAPVIGPDLKEGDEAEIQYVFQAKQGGQRWAYTKYGTRLKLSHFNPYIVISPKE